VPTLIFSCDWDVLYKWPFRNVAWSAVNKVGYLGRDGTLVYPSGYGVRRVAYCRFRRRHTKADLPPSPHDENIEAFFSQNRDNPFLLYCGTLALATGNNAPFRNPIKLPILTPLAPGEFEQKWQEFVSLLRPGDLIQSVDTRSLVSRVIAAVDHGVWSHVTTYIGDGQVFEATTSGVVEQSIEAYRSPRFRLGVYRPPATASQTDTLIAALRSQIGKPYAYRKVLTVALRKLLNQEPSAGKHRHRVTPNELVIMYDFPLIYVL
jgi:hypothetical protein